MYNDSNFDIFPNDIDSFYLNITNQPDDDELRNYHPENSSKQCCTSHPLSSRAADVGTVELLLEETILRMIFANRGTFFRTWMKIILK